MPIWTKVIWCFAGGGEPADRDDVGAICRVGFGLAEIDVVEGGGVDDRVGFLGIEHGGAGGGVGDVEFSAAGEGNGGVVAVSTFDGAEQIVAELAGGTEDGDAHKEGPLRMVLEERIAGNREFVGRRRREVWRGFLRVGWSVATFWCALL